MNARQKHQERLERRKAERQELMQRQQQVQQDYQTDVDAKKRAEKKKNLRNILSTTEDTQRVGAETITKRWATKQLNVIQDDLDDVDDTLTATEKIVGRLNTWIGFSPFMSKKAVKKQAKKKRAARMKAQDAHDAQEIARLDELDQQRDINRARARENRTGDEDNDHDSDYDSDVEVLDQNLQNLNRMANQMHGEIGLQNTMIDEANNDMDGIDEKMRKQNRDLKKLGG